MKPTPGPKTLALLIVALLAVVVCGDDSGDPSADVTTVDSSTSTTSTTEALPPGDEPRTEIELVCAGGPFPPAALDEEPDPDAGIESADTPVGEALRDLLELTEGGGRDVPDQGWRELTTVTTPDVTVHELANGSPPELWVATVQDIGDGGRTEGGFVEPCTPRPWVDDMLVGYWWPAEGADTDSDTTELEVLVQEDSCDNGRGPEGRVGEPQITYGADVVVVMFPVEPRDEDEVQSCPANPPAAVTLELSEPLGDRELLDGGTWPARTPSDEVPAAVGVVPD